MMIEARYDGDRGLIFTLTGEFRFDEVLEAFESLLGDDRFAGIRYFLVDRSQVTGYEMPLDRLHRLLNICATLAKTNGSLYHIFVSGSDLQYGMGRVAEVLEQETCWKVLNFRSLAEAEAWIDENVD